MKTRIEKSRDADEVMKLYSSLVGSAGCAWNEYYPTLEDVLPDAENGDLYVARAENGEIIAAASMGAYGDLDEIDVWSKDIKNPCEVCRLGVKLDRQGHGLAREMLAHLETEARKRGFDGVRLLVSEKNTHAVKLYDSMGYAHAGKTRMYDLDWTCREKRL